MTFNHKTGWYEEEEKTEADKLREAERELLLVKRAVEMLITVGHLDRDKYDKAVEFLKGLD